MPNSLIKFSNIEPLLQDEAFICALQVNSLSEYKSKLLWHERNIYSPHYDGPLSSEDSIVGVELLSTPEKEGKNSSRTSVRIIKIFGCGENPFLVIGKTKNREASDTESSFEFGKFKNLEDAAKASISIHESSNFELSAAIADAGDKFIEKALPSGKAPANNSAALDKVEAEIQDLEEKIFDRTVWLKHTKDRLQGIDPQGKMHDEYLELHRLTVQFPSILSDHGVSNRFQSLFDVENIRHDIHHNEVNIKNDTLRLERLRNQYEGMSRQVNERQTHNADGFSMAG